jgi:hypothetical protein
VYGRKLDERVDDLLRQLPEPGFELFVRQRREMPADLLERIRSDHVSPP